MAGPNCKAKYEYTIYGWVASCTNDSWQDRPVTTKAKAARRFRAHKHDLDESYPNDIREALTNLRAAGLLNGRDDKVR